MNDSAPSEPHSDRPGLTSRFFRISMVDVMTILLSSLLASVVETANRRTPSSMMHSFLVHALVATPWSILEGVAAAISKGAPFLGRRTKDNKAESEDVVNMRRRRAGRRTDTETAVRVVETNAAALPVIAVCQGQASYAPEQPSAWPKQE
jgi:hypothetical protein